MAKRTPVAAVSITLHKGSSTLLVRRIKPPWGDAWTPAGGPIQWGETTRAAAQRLLREETGVTGEITDVIDVVDQRWKSGLETHFVIIRFAARWIAGAPKAGASVAEAKFFTPAELETLARENRYTGPIATAALAAP